MKIGIQNEGSVRTFWDGTILSIVLDTDKLSDCIDFSEKTNNYNFILYELWGYRHSDLKSLANFSKVLGLKINSDTIDYSLLPQWKELQYLNLKNTGKVNLDLSELPNLSHFKFGYSKKIHGLSNASQLKELGIECRGSKDNFTSLKFLSRLNNLEYLGIGGSKISNLKGIEEFTKLSWLDLSDNKQLDSIKHIASLESTLERFEIENSKKINSFKELGVLTHLKYLRLSDCGDIKSIRFTKKMPNLNFFSFVGTTITNGDLTPLIDKKFAHIGFFNKKHYSHSNEEILKLISDLK